jgi:hypothetical protein
MFTFLQVSPCWSKLKTSSTHVQLIFPIVHRFAMVFSSFLGGGNPPAQWAAKVCAMRLVESPWNAWGCSAVMIMILVGAYTYIYLWRDRLCINMY